MKHTLFALAAFFALAVPPSLAQEAFDPGAQPLSMLRLFDGSILWGTVIGHDAQTLHFERLDNGGKVRVPWARLDRALADELLETYGYVDHSADELMLEAERLILDDGREVVGRIVNRTETELWVKTADSVVPVPKLRLKGAATTVQVPALDVYTREELYSQELPKIDPTSPQSEWDMSIFCERIFDFAHAIAHLEAAQALDGRFKVEEIKAALQRNTTKLASQVQIDALREIDHARARGKFDDAEQLCDQFIERYATSGLRGDAAKKKLQIQKAREAFLRERTVSLWHAWLGRMTQQTARSSNTTLEAALGYVDEKLREDVLTNVHKELTRYSPSITPDLVQKYWTERKDGRWRSATYGQATWLLGETEARKGYEEEQADEPKGETDAARAKLEERIKRYLQNQEVVRKAKGASEEEEDQRETFWLELSASSRAGWMLAYYVEHSGDMQIRENGVHFRACPDCNGTGVREVINLAQVTRQGQQAGPASQLVNCPTCFHIGLFRSVSYR